MSAHQDSFFDVIIVGGNLSCALLAGLFAKKGKKVFLVENQFRKVSESDLFFENIRNHFSGNLFAGVDDSFIFKKILEELALSESLEQKFQPLENLVQIVTPSLRVGVPTDLKELDLELSREFPPSIHEKLFRYFEKIAQLTPEKSQVFSKFLADLPPRTKEFFSFSNRSILKSLRLGEEKELWDIILPMCCQLGFLNPLNMNQGQCESVLALVLKGLKTYPGGEAALIDELFALVESAGGIIKRNAMAEALLSDDAAKNGKIKGVLLNSHEGAVFAENVVLGDNHNRLYSTLNARIKDRNLQTDLAQVEFSHWRYEITIDVNAEVVPPQMGENIVFVEDFNFPLEEENLLFIQKEIRSNSVTRLRIQVLVPTQRIGIDHEYLQRLSGRILRQVEVFIPYLSFNLVDVSPDFRLGKNPIKEAYPFKSWRELPESLLQFSLREGTQYEELGQVFWATPHENLFFCGRILWPWLGSYGEALSAWRVYQSLLKKPSEVSS